MKQFSHCTDDEPETTKRIYTFALSFGVTNVSFVMDREILLPQMLPLAAALFSLFIFCRRARAHVSLTKVFYI